jgi:hypothetical protein
MNLVPIGKKDNDARASTHETDVTAVAARDLADDREA